MLRADDADADLRPGVALRAHGGAHHSTQERQLADVGERVGDRALEDRFVREALRRSLRERRIQGGQAGEEPFAGLAPALTGYVLPASLAAGHALAKDCELKLEGNDAMQFNTKELVVAKDWHSKALWIHPFDGFDDWAGKTDQMAQATYIIPQPESIGVAHVKASVVTAIS